MYIYNVYNTLYSIFLALIYITYLSASDWIIIKFCIYIEAKYISNIAIILAQMYGRYNRPAHMLIASAQAS